MEQLMAQVSSVGSQQKWKYGSYKVSIASEQRKISGKCNLVYNGLR